ncbi:MAG: hypothetical protein UV65_C0021G0009 [Parcubacteria group bacterium GW2011_GWF2_43_11]|nr:MAG: hypothetical protein UV65_C0021G0009 [Parcubacteria group bacterium GW2011_GWF2_43_11]
MFGEKEPQFNKPEAVPEAKSEQKAEVKENPLDRLRGEIKDMSLGLQKEGVPVDERARVDINKFKDVYPGQSIESDNAWVKDLKGRWENAAASGNKMSWLYGREQMKQKVAQENPTGGVWEMLATSILHKNLGKDFIVARTSEYDDARYKVDNIILDRKTGHIVCAFDEIGATTGERFEEKKNKILERNWQRGGTDLKYGISFEEKAGKMELKKGSLYQIPLFYLALSEEEIKKTLNDPSQEKKVFGNFVESAKKQIKEIGAGPAHPKLRSRLEFFGSVLEKL